MQERRGLPLAARVTPPSPPDPQPRDDTLLEFLYVIVICPVPVCHQNYFLNIQFLMIYRVVLTNRFEVYFQNEKLPTR